MEDKDLMEKELLTIKGACDLYLHGTVESSTAEVHAAFKDALNKSLDIQNKIYCLNKYKSGFHNRIYALAAGFLFMLRSLLPICFSVFSMNPLFVQIQYHSLRTSESNRKSATPKRGTST